MDGSELRQCSHLPQGKHHPFSPSERQAKILGPVIGPPVKFPSFRNTKAICRSPIETKATSHDLFISTVPLAVERHEDLIHMPRPAARSHPSNTLLSGFPCERRAEPIPPKPQIDHHGQSDDFGRRPDISKRAALGHSRTLSECPAPLKKYPLTPPDIPLRDVTHDCNTRAPRENP